MMSANMRFVEVSDFTGALMEVQTEAKRFRLRITSVEGELVVSGDRIEPFTLEGDALDYHEYTIVYDAVLDQAALWIDGVERVTGIGGNIPSPVPYFIFGATGESITYSHWNEATFAIIPEPATVAFVSGLGALLIVVVVRRRQRKCA